MVLDELLPEHRALGIRLDMARMAGNQRVILFTPDGTLDTLSSGMRQDVARRDELDRRWATLAASLDAATLAGARDVLRAGLPLQVRRLPEVPADWSPSFLTPGGHWLQAPSSNTATAAA
jgi:hypothetical protein